MLTELWGVQFTFVFLTKSSKEERTMIWFLDSFPMMAVAKCHWVSENMCHKEVTSSQQASARWLGLSFFISSFSALLIHDCMWSWSVSSPVLESLLGTPFPYPLTTRRDSRPRPRQRNLSNLESSPQCSWLYSRQKFISTIAKYIRDIKNTIVGYWKEVLVRFR